MDLALLAIDTGRVAIDTLWMGKPVWMWLAFLALVIAILAFDLGVLHRHNHEISVRESLLLSAFYISLGLAFGGFVWWSLGDEAGLAYVTGFVVEKTLALDNVFVIALIFSYFAIPRLYQHRVLFWGILGVLVLRAIMIGVGATLVARFEWVLLIFAAFLVFTGIRMLWSEEKPAEIGDNALIRFMRRRLNVTDRLHDDRFFVRQPHPGTGRTALFVTPLFMALVMVEVADIVFAVDSVPAIFAITTDPFLVYTSNIFAILGLRALYFALAAMIHRFRYLKPALAIVLIFIGGKVFAAEFMGLEKFPALLSLAITFAIIAAGVVWSLVRSSAEDRTVLQPVTGDRSAGEHPTGIGAGDERA